MSQRKPHFWMSHKKWGTYQEFFKEHSDESDRLPDESGSLFFKNGSGFLSG